MVCDRSRGTDSSERIAKRVSRGFLVLSHDKLRGFYGHGILRQIGLLCLSRRGGLKCGRGSRLARGRSSTCWIAAGPEANTYTGPSTSSLGRAVVATPVHLVDVRLGLPGDLTTNANALRASAQ